MISTARAAAVLSVDEGEFEIAAEPVSGPVLVAPAAKPQYPLLTEFLGTDPTKPTGHQQQWDHWDLDQMERKLQQQRGGARYDY